VAKRWNVLIVMYGDDAPGGGSGGRARFRFPIGHETGAN